MFESLAVEGLELMPSDKGHSLMSRFYVYLDDLASMLYAEFALDPAESFYLIADLADHLYLNSKMPPFPDDESNIAVVARWLGEAEHRGFRELLYNYVADMG